MNENELVKLIVDTLHSDVTWIDGIDKDIIAEVIRLTSSLEDIKSPSNKTPLRDVLSPSQKQQLNNFFNSIQKQALASQVLRQIKKKRCNIYTINSTCQATTICTTLQ